MTMRLFVITGSSSASGGILTPAKTYGYWVGRTFQVLKQQWEKN